MNVYVLIGNDWDGDHIISIHKSNETAEAKIAKLDKFHWVEEYELEE